MDSSAWMADADILLFNSGNVVLVEHSYTICHIYYAQKEC